MTFIDNKDNKFDSIDNYEHRILVMTGGFCFIGWINPQNRNTLLEANTIRRWGTQNGIGELKKGLLKETVLDYIGDIDISPMQLIFSFKLDW